MPNSVSLSNNFVTDNIYICVVFDPAGVRKSFNMINLSKFSADDDLCKIWRQKK